MSSDLKPFQRPRFARSYERLSAESEQRGVSTHRDRLLSGLVGRVLDVGAGNGLNFTHYPPTGTEVVAVEPEDLLRARAEQAAAGAVVPVRVLAGHIDALPAPDGTFDAAVASLVLCSVPDLAHGLTEIRRILKPGGELRFYEHVRSTHPIRGTMEDLATPLWKRCAAAATPTAAPPMPSPPPASRSNNSTASDSDHCGLPPPATTSSAAPATQPDRRRQDSISGYPEEDR